MTLREKILAAADRPLVKVVCPEWDCDVFIARMSGADRDRFESYVAHLQEQPPGTPRNLRGLLVTLTACDEKGERIFTDADAEAVGRKAHQVLDRLWNAAVIHNGLGADVQEQAEKN